ncbi:hypothetical protein FY138_17490 [Agrobacterium tumefaciens]|nr:hypothetical protein FY149_07415 [Agrobacterium tumefaciens]UXT35256.1 hypothetical protein FY138_17490 [Agrobacterium tumefaciens]
MILASGFIDPGQVPIILSSLAGNNASDPARQRRINPIIVFEVQKYEGVSAWILRRSAPFTHPPHRQ